MKLLVFVAILAVLVFLALCFCGCQIRGEAEANIYYPEKKVGDPWRSRGFTTLQAPGKDDR